MSFKNSRTLVNELLSTAAPTIKDNSLTEPGLHIKCIKWIRVYGLIARREDVTRTLVYFHNHLNKDPQLTH